MSDMYAMQRANGDWFALEHPGGFRVPVFHSHSEAMQARAFNTEMLLFKPVMLDERALKDLGAEASANAAHFWCVDGPSNNLKRGQRIEFDQLAATCREATQSNGDMT